MSLEQALAENTKALRELIEITAKSMGLAQQIIASAQGGAAPTNTPEQATAPEVAQAKKSPDTASTEKSSPQQQPAAEQSSPEPTPAAENAQGKTYDFASVGKLITQLAGDPENRAKAVALLQRFGVKNLRPLENDAEKLTEIGQLAEKILAGEYDPRDAQVEA
jgi:cell division septation protein DedD